MAPEEIITQCLKSVDFKIRSSAFTTLSKEADKEHPPEVKAKLILATRIFSLVLAPDDAINPYHPTFTYADGSTSFSLDDLKKEEVEVVKQMVTGIDDSFAKAHLSDICWIKSRKDYQFGISAIDEYLKVAAELLKMSEYHFTTNPLKRVLSLSRSLGQTEKALPQVTELIFENLERDAKNEKDNLRPKVDLISILTDVKLDEPSLERALAICDSLSEVARKSGNFFTGHQIKNLAASFARKKGDEERVRTYLTSAAEIYEFAAGIQKEPYAACDLYERSIQAYRKVGGKRDKVDELLGKLIQIQKDKPKILSRISSPEIDISELVEKARAHVQRKDFMEALLYFSHIAPPLNYEKQKEHSKKLMDEFPFQHLFKKQIIDKEGKTVAVVPPMILSMGGTEENALALWGRVVEDARMHHTVQAQGLILPALREIALRFEPSLGSMMNLFENHPFIEDGHQYLVARGIQHGFYFQWPEALHLLIPQLEHAIRFVLQQREILTTKFDEEGIQEAHLLNSLLFKEETKQIFGENLITDLSVLLVDKFGSNFRNLQAHGLLEAGHFYTTNAVYLWWLIVKFFFLPVVATESTIEKAEQKKENTAPQEEDGKNVT
jgi:hypothetical protein